MLVVAVVLRYFKLLRVKADTIEEQGEPPVVEFGDARPNSCRR